MSDTIIQEAILPTSGVTIRFLVVTMVQLVPPIMFPEISLDGDVPRSPSYGVYISQLIRFASLWSHVDDFNNRNLF